MRISRVFTLLSALILLAGFTVSAQPNHQETIKKALKQKTLRTGTLDLYDVNLDAVRNLRMINVAGDVSDAGGALTSNVRFRDINTGDIVTLKLTIKIDGAAATITETEFIAVEPIVSETGKDKVYTDGEVMEEMKVYLDKQSEFTGFVMLFDEKAEKMRNLTLVDIASDVRHLGNNYISTAEFKDNDSDEVLEVDITVKNENGRLSVKRMRIRKVK